MSKKCSNCGEILDDNAKFCDKCGAKLVVCVSGDDEDTYKNMSADVQSAKQQPKRKKRRILKIIIAVIVIYVILRIIIGLLPSDDANDSDASIAGAENNIETENDLNNESYTQTDISYDSDELPWEMAEYIFALVRDGETSIKDELGETFEDVWAYYAVFELTGAEKDISDINVTVYYECENGIYDEDGIQTETEFIYYSLYSTADGENEILTVIDSDEGDDIYSEYWSIVQGSNADYQREGSWPKQFWYTETESGVQYIYSEWNIPNNNETAYTMY